MRLLLVLLISTLTPIFASAQSWPQKPIRMVIPYPPGGPTGVMGRLVATKLPELLGQPVIVDNKGGGNGSIAGNFVAKSAPDGYTLMIATAATHAGNPNLMKSLPYDSLVDFAPAGFYGFITPGGERKPHVADVLGIIADHLEHAPIQ